MGGACSMNGGKRNAYMYVVGRKARGKEAARKTKT
jgi:hypothetical protein